MQISGMRFIGTAAIDCLCAAIFLGLISAANAAELPHLAVDPVFGLRFDPNRVHFETTMTDSCSGLTPSSSPAYWLMAYLPTPNGFYYVEGTYTDVDMAPQNWKPDSHGKFAFVNKDNACNDMFLDAIEAFTDYQTGPSPAAAPIKPAEQRRLALDLVLRFSKAFGGLDKFKTELKRQHKWPQNRDYSILIDVLR